ncbi:HlyD family secretion protein [Armatimonadetes bacterium GBS]|nr:HlyD family secretion protein [Armatimonadetes bacterium GBS]
MKRRVVVIVAIVVAVAAVFWWRGRANQETQNNQPEFRTAEVTREDVVRTINATGVLRTYNIVDVKSKAGGIVSELLVDVGDVVQKGQLLARIAPADTLAVYNQAKADLEAANARIEQAEESLRLQREQSELALRQAEANLEAARARLQQAEERARIQPTLTESQIQSARTALETARKNLEQLEKVTIPQERAQAQANYNAARQQVETAQRNYERLQSLLQKGFVSQQQVDNALAQLENARSQLVAAEKRLQTLEADIQTRLETARARVQEAEANLRSAEANRAQVELVKQALEEARSQYRQAQVALEQARANLRQIRLREADIAAAKAQRARADAQLYNAKVQLDSTTITAPLSGVVIARFVERGTIVPPGTSLFSQGNTLLQIADTSRMYVEVSVDEADIGNVKIGQPVTIRIDAYPREKFRGKVSRIDPQAVVEQNVTVVKVRVEIEKPDPRLKPGLNASCEFLVARKEDVLAVPNEAVNESPEGAYVEVMVNGRPQRRAVKVGVQGNEKTEIIDGLREGEVVVTGRIFTQQDEGPGSPFGRPFGPRMGGSQRPGAGGGGGAGMRGGGGGGR